MPLTHQAYRRYAALTDEELLRDCKTTAFHATGPGGQGVNTADSAVRMCHLPTGIVVVSREDRSQLRNRQTCLAKIRRELRKRSIPPKVRKKTKPTAASKRRRLEDKRARSQIKASRRRVQDD